MKSASVPKQNNKTKIRWILVFVLASLILIGIHQILAAKARRIDGRIGELKSELSRHAKIGREVDKIKKKLAVEEKKDAILEELKAHQQATVQRFFDILNTRPADAVEIKKLTQDPSGVLIVGQVNDSEALAGYMKALKAHSWIGDVRFSSASTATSNQDAAISFRIQLKEKRPKSAEPSPKKKRWKKRKKK